MPTREARAKGISWPRTKPILRPRMIFKYATKTGWNVLFRTYTAFSIWQERIYPEILARTPTYKGTDERRTPGFVNRYIKLMWTSGEYGIRYKAIGVPGGTVRGNPAYHARMAIYSLHEGRAAVTITGNPLTFPIKAGTTFRNPKVARQGPGRTRGIKNWAVTKKVFQKPWGIGRNPWIAKISLQRRGMLIKLLHLEYVKASRMSEKKGLKKIEIG